MERVLFSPPAWPVVRYEDLRLLKSGSDLVGLKRDCRRLYQKENARQAISGFLLQVATLTKYDPIARLRRFVVPQVYQMENLLLN